MKIFLDDERLVPEHWTDRDTWTIVRSDIEFLSLMKSKFDTVTEISFDHDLGLKSRSGYDMITWLEAQIADGNNPQSLKFLNVHSMNPIGRERIRVVMDRILLRLSMVRG